MLASGPSSTNVVQGFLHIALPSVVTDEAAKLLAKLPAADDDANDCSLPVA